MILICEHQKLLMILIMFGHYDIVIFMKLEISAYLRNLKNT